MCVCAGGRSAGREGGEEGWVCKGQVGGVQGVCSRGVFTGVQLGNRPPITNNTTCLLHTSDAMEEAAGFSS